MKENTNTEPDTNPIILVIALVIIMMSVVCFVIAARYYAKDKAVIERIK